MRGQLGEAEILRCIRKPGLTAVGRTEWSPGSAPPGGFLLRHRNGGAGPAPGHNALPPGAQQASPPGPGGLAASQSSPRGSPGQPATVGRAPTAARHPPCREEPGQGSQGGRGRGQGKRGTPAIPVAPLGRTRRSHRTAADAVPFRTGSIGGTARQPTAPATIQTRLRAWPRSACARGAGGPRS